MHGLAVLGFKPAALKGEHFVRDPVRMLGGRAGFSRVRGGVHTVFYWLCLNEYTPLGANADPQRLNGLQHEIVEAGIVTPEDVTEFRQGLVPVQARSLEVRSRRHERRPGPHRGALQGTR